MQRSTGTKRTVSAGGGSRRSTSSGRGRGVRAREARRQPAFVLCVTDRGDGLSVLRGKLYRVVKPEANDPRSMLRVIDETAEDYLYPRDWFVPVAVPAARREEVRQALVAPRDAA